VLRVERVARVARRLGCAARRRYAALRALLARLMGRLRAALVGGFVPRFPLTLARAFLPYRRRMAAATWAYVPNVPF